MSDNDIASATVVAVLLPDGWHLIVPGSFSAGPLSLGAGADLGVPGFRFEEADVGRPYRPTALVGPLNSIIAIRQAGPAARRSGEPNWARAARNVQRADPGARSRALQGTERQAL
jgi:hypothetical protein